MIVTVLYFTGCKSTKNENIAIKENLPKSYVNNQIDSTSFKLPNWKNLFFDSCLIALIDTALKNNFDLKLALQKVEITRANLKLNKTNNLPDLNLLSSIGLRKFGEYTMDGVGNFDTRRSSNINKKQQIPDPLPDYNFAFQTSWEIDLWGKLKNMRKSAYAKFMATELGKEFIKTQLISEITTTYFELLALDYESKILDDNIRLQNDALDLVIAQKEVGKANELGVELMNAQLLSSKTIKAEVFQSIIETEAKINFLCGSFPKVFKRDTNYNTNKIEQLLIIGVPSELLKNRPDILQAEFELISSNADVNAAKAAFYPSLNINATFGIQSFNSALLLELPASLAYNALNGLTMPLLNRRKLKADLMQNEAIKKEAYINYEKTVVNGFKETYIAINKIKNTKTMYNLKKDEVELLKKSIYTSSELFKAGKANYLEVITSQKNALQSQIELINFNKRNNLAIIELYRSIGGGWNK
jgi:NodT family efflux transporter outer membrane factor (OMF) lipoprotein